MWLLTEEGAGDELGHLVAGATHLWQVSELPIQHPLKLKKINDGVKSLFRYHFYNILRVNITFDLFYAKHTVSLSFLYYFIRHGSLIKLQIQMKSLF